MTFRLTYNRHYTASRALVVGIDNYHFARPLKGAIKDANRVAEALHDTGFEHITLLTSAEETTKASILREFFKYRSLARDDDRLLFFFAGHGVVHRSNSGYRGLMLPIDGKPDDIDTLITWKEFTDGGEFIPAKHILFIVDACFGGLIMPSARAALSTPDWTEDAISKYARQAISSGGASEYVDDHLGPEPGHSIFTSFLIRGLTNAAAGTGRRQPVTASWLGEYLTSKVRSFSPAYKQTPQYERFEGEGNFVFLNPTTHERTFEPNDHLDEISILTLNDARITDDYLIRQRSLDIFLKDGFKFFPARKKMLIERLRDRNKSTRVAIVHPDFTHIEAVASMDVGKRDEPSIQRKETIASILELQSIATSLTTENYNPREHHHFRGYHTIPTWNGFIGDDSGAISLYFSHPYRGPLNTILFRNQANKFFESIKKDFDQIFIGDSMRPEDNLWNYNPPSSSRSRNRRKIDL